MAPNEPRTLIIEYTSADNMRDGALLLLEQTVTRLAIALAHGDADEARRQLGVHFDRLPLAAPNDRERWFNGDRWRDRLYPVTQDCADATI